MGTVTGMLAECRRHIGYREGRTTPFGVWYGNQVGSSAYDGAAWCDMFLAYCANRTGNLTAVGMFAYTPSHVNWFKNRGRWHAGKAGIRAGDIVFFDWDGGVVDHVGIVEKVLSGGVLQTIEGNTENMCRRRNRAGSIEGYGRPAYTGTAPAPQPPTPSPSNWTENVVKQLPTLRKGARGEHVQTLQGLLRARSQNVALDGDFGPLTDRAVRKVQDWGGVTADGVVGPKTWPVLLRVH
jgi:hypothetical protein